MACVAKGRRPVRYRCALYSERLCAYYRAAGPPCPWRQAVLQSQEARPATPCRKRPGAVLFSVEGLFATRNLASFCFLIGGYFRLAICTALLTRPEGLGRETLQRRTASTPGACVGWRMAASWPTSSSGPTRSCRRQTRLAPMSCAETTGSGARAMRESSRTQTRSRSNTQPQ